MTELLIRLFIRDKDNVQDPTVRQQYGTLSGLTGICLNILLFLGKLVAGTVSGSIAITADAFNNLSDAGSSVVTLIGFRLAGQKPDRHHPFGHGRVEYLSGLAVSVVILLMGFELGKTSFEKILSPAPVEFSLLPVIILPVSILVKGWMYLFNRKLGKKLDSAAMMATAADSLSDMVSTGVVLLGTLIGHFFNIQLDGWLGILVAVFILYTGYNSMKDTIDPLLGRAPIPNWWMAFAAGCWPLRKFSACTISSSMITALAGCSPRCTPRWIKTVISPLFTMSLTGWSGRFCTNWAVKSASIWIPLPLVTERQRNAALWWPGCWPGLTQG